MQYPPRAILTVAGIDPPDRVAMRENALPILEAEGELSGTFELPLTQSHRVKLNGIEDHERVPGLLVTLV